MASDGDRDRPFGSWAIVATCGTFEEVKNDDSQTEAPIEVIFVNRDTRKIEKLLLTPIDGKVGFYTDPVQVKEE